MSEQKIWKVSEVNSAVREIIENSLYPFWLQGEVGTLNIHRSGHVYMTLKDRKTQLKTVFFRGAQQAQSIGLKVGTEIEVFGKLTVYEVRGEYQFSVQKIRPLGIGQLQQKFEQLKQKLAAEGLFDSEKKIPVPALPRRIGVVTSPGGAAVRDFLQIINRRFPNVNIRIYPAAVQGKGAEKKLAAGVDFFNRTKGADVIVLTRGGGSLEDLWAFNEEVLARSISQSRIPVISAVGHEIDFTICDFVADMRVPTPSAAAELVIGRQEELTGRLSEFKRRLGKSLEFQMKMLRSQFKSAADSYVFREPVHMLREKQQVLDELSGRIDNSAREKISSVINKIEDLSSRCNDAATGGCSDMRAKYTELNTKLCAMNPLSVLKRGYSVLVDKKSGQSVKGTNLEKGSRLRAFVSEGILNLEFINGEKIDFRIEEISS